MYINDLKAYLEIAHVYYLNACYTVPTYYAPNLYLNGKLITGDVVIPNGTSIISAYAFYKNKNITSVTIPDSVTSIGHYAFENCTMLTSATIGNGITDIGNSSVGWFWDHKGPGIGAFKGCTELTNVKLGNNVTIIGYEVFRNCGSLTNITIPDSVTNIEKNAFQNCSSLMSIDVAGSNEKYCSIDGNLYNKAQTELIQYAVGKKDTSFSIPQGVTSVGDRAFGRAAAAW